MDNAVGVRITDLPIWRHPEASFDMTTEQLDRVPPGFVNGDVWKRFLSEQAQIDSEMDRTWDRVKREVR